MKKLLLTYLYITCTERVAATVKIFIFEISYLNGAVFSETPIIS